MNATKWIKLPVLLSEQEMTQLVDELCPFLLFQVGTVLQAGAGEVSIENFLSDYRIYLQAVREGQSPNTRPFALVMTRSEETITRQELNGQREIIRPLYPSIQIQPHSFQFDHTSLACRSMVYGVDSIPWGLLFSYPHLFENPKTYQIETVDDRFVNTALFKTIQRFIRNQTRPTPIAFGGQRVNVPIRLGKECFEWIQTYPWTTNRGINVGK